MVVVEAPAIHECSGMLFICGYKRVTMVLITVRVLKSPLITTPAPPSIWDDRRIPWGLRTALPLQGTQRWHRISVNSSKQNKDHIGSLEAHVESCRFIFLGPCTSGPAQEPLPSYKDFETIDEHCGLLRAYS